MSCEKLYQIIKYLNKPPFNGMKFVISKADRFKKIVVGYLGHRCSIIIYGFAMLFSDSTDLGMINIKLFNSNVVNKFNNDVI